MSAAPPKGSSALVKDVSPLAALFLEKIPLIDVRAPVEFAAGHLPGAVNLPLLDDQERAAVGAEYKLKGPEAAVALGHRLVSGANRERKISAWREFVQKNPKAIFYCFRGGLRSQISREWLRHAGTDRPLMVGGYKAARQFLLESLNSSASALKLVVIAGPTGSGKTSLVASLMERSVDLENLAHHRGSAFGAYADPQPSQVDFENQLSVELMKKTGQVFLEDESRMIGKLTVPAPLFDRLREAPVILIEEPIDVRIENIRREYVDGPSRFGSPYPGLKNSVQAISRKLGGVRTKEILELLEARADKDWIRLLLEYYYDPLYHAGLKRRSPLVLFRGSVRECLKAIQTGLPVTKVTL